MGYRPLAIELFCGTFGWSAGWLEMGGRVIGYDIEHLPHHGPVPAGADLVLQDVHTIDGRRFKDAELILASPPCPEFSYMAMPWSRAKQIARALRGDGGFPEGYKGSRTVAELTALFDACFRIQREASEAAGRHIPMVVENVKGAQPWVGKARWLYGSFALWGDIPALMPKPHKAQKDPFRAGTSSHQKADMSGWGRDDREAQKANPDGTSHGTGSWFKIADSKNRGASERATKNEGGSWFAVAHNTTSGHSRNPVHRQINEAWRAKHYDQAPKMAEHDAVKHGSKSSARKAASARIAKIPPRLSAWIARYYFPESAERAS